MFETTVDSAAVRLWEEWPALSTKKRVRRFKQLPRHEADDFFLSLEPREQTMLLLSLPQGEQRLWMRVLAPDDAVDLIQEAPAEERDRLLELLDETTRREVRALLAHAEDDAGGLMNPRFARIRPEMTVGEAIRYLRKQATSVETIYYVYVLDSDQTLRGVVSFRQLFQAAEDKVVRDIMVTEVITVPEQMDQELVARLFQKYNVLALPVVDGGGKMVGIITFDDIADAIREEATEDIQKIGGVEALEAPYLTIEFTRLLKKRAGWLAALFLGEMLTATAMTHYQNEIASAVVLALFVPLIISSGGNSGSQATTLVIRAIALGEVRLRDWWRVLRREIGAGLGLGVILGSIGLARILLWQAIGGTYGVHFMRIALTVAFSLVGVVLWGSVAGSMLPFVLRRVGFDPASASAPLVATLVDVTGLVIYFTIASIVLRGVLL
ncbi:MAG TPA: magnesium transporter [Gemmatimonadales bacterium]|nr:magnesium transporter [Gemmatimonadales bacterium]